MYIQANEIKNPGQMMSYDAGYIWVSLPCSKMADLDEALCQPKAIDHRAFR